MKRTISKQRLDQLNGVLGLDCSKYQKNITWSLARKFGIEFAIIKLTEGGTYAESMTYNVKARAAQALKDGVRIGYYHFCRPGNVADPVADARDELANVLKHLPGMPGAQLPFALDMEAMSTQLIWEGDRKQMVTTYLQTFTRGLEEKGIPVMIYTGRYFANKNMLPVFGSLPLWLAVYPANPETYSPRIPDGWNNWSIWQWTSQGKIDGYTGNIDLNIMRRDVFEGLP